MQGTVLLGQEKHALQTAPLGGQGAGRGVKSSQGCLGPSRLFCSSEGEKREGLLRASLSILRGLRARSSPEPEARN